MNDFRFILVCAFLLLTGPASAQTIYVVDPGGTEDFTTIQDCIDAALDGDTCLVNPGTYLENVDFRDEKDIALRSSSGPEVTVIDGQGQGRAVTLGFGMPVQAVLDGFTIQGGLNETGAGGGVFCNGPVTISDCIVTGNVAAAGGGIGSTGPVTVLNSTISLNIATMPYGGIGGGIYSWSGGLTLSDSTVTANVATGSTEYGGTGGGIHSEGGDLVLTNCTVSDNLVDGGVVSGGDAGGVYCDGNLTVSGSRITGNFGASSGGGILCKGEAIFHDTALSGNTAPVGGSVCSIGNATFQGSTVSDNVAGWGGGVFCAGDLVMRKSTISRNTASGDAGGIYCGQGHHSLTNILVVGNQAGGLGGGIHTSESILILEHATLSGNQAAGGGGIACLGYAAVVENSILWGNLAAAQAEIYIGTGDAMVTYSDVQGGWEGIGNLDTDPLFAGPDDFHLSGISPCLDQTINAGVEEDIDGDPRPTGPGFDMGADEVSLIPLPAYEAYGRIPDGDQTHPNDVSFWFPGRPGDVPLYYEVYDIDPPPGEVRILLNGREVGQAPVTANESWSGMQILILPDEYVSDAGDNLLVFDNTHNPTSRYLWGVRYVSLCRDLDADGYGDPANADCLSAYRDCNDADPAINPAATEIPGNGVNEDCNPLTPPWNTPASVVPADSRLPSGVANDLLALLVPGTCALFWRRKSKRRG